VKPRMRLACVCTVVLYAVAISTVKGFHWWSPPRTRTVLPTCITRVHRSGMAAPPWPLGFQIKQHLGFATVGEIRLLGDGVDTGSRMWWRFCFQ